MAAHGVDLLRRSGAFLCALWCVVALFSVSPVSGQVTPGTYSLFFQSFPGCGVAVDGLGFIYVAVCNAGTVVKFDPTNYSPVTSFNQQLLTALTTLSNSDTDTVVPSFISVSADGTLWILDDANLQLVAVSNSTSPTSLRTISLVSLSGGQGLAIAPNSNNLWLLFMGSTNPVQQWSPTGQVLTSWGPSTIPALSDYTALGVGVDGLGNVYVGGCYPASAFTFLPPDEFDYDAAAIQGCDIRQFNAQGALIQTFVPVADYDINYDGLTFFTSIVVDADGNVYGNDLVNDLLYQWSSDGVQFPQSADTPQVFPIALAPTGGVIALDGYGFIVYDFTENLTVSNSFDISVNTFEYETGIAFSPDYNTLYVSSVVGGPIAAFNASGYILGYLGAAFLVSPQNVATDAAGNIYVTDAGLGVVVKMSSNGTFLSTISDPNTPFAFGEFQGLEVNPVNGNLVVGDEGNSRLVVFAPDGTVVSQYTTTSPAGYSAPQDIAITSTGSIVYTDLTGYVTVLSPSFTVTSQFTIDSPWQPVGVALSGDGRIFVSDLMNNQVYSFNFTGSLLSYIATSSENLFIVNLAYNPVQESLYACDYFNNRIITFPIAPSTAVPTVSGNLCAILYSLPGTVDYPWSIATSLAFQYNPSPVTTPYGTAVTLVSGSGIRTYTNRFGVAFTRAISIASAGINGADNLIYLGSSVPVDSGGLIFTLASPVQLAGTGPNQLSSVLSFYNASGLIAEGLSGRLDPVGQAFLSTIPGFTNITIGASNINSLAASYPTCQALITFSNGLRPPTQPSASNGAVHFAYSYFISDGASYSVVGNLSFTATSAFASVKDQIGNPFQSLVNVTGTRLYTFLSTSATVQSTVSGLNLAINPLASQRFYPYALLAAAPGVYSVGTAPFFDEEGVGFNLSPSVPANGKAPGTGTQYSATWLYVASSTATAVLTEGNSAAPPLATLQQQTYSFLT